MLNNGGPRYKRSKLERQMNTDIIWCVVILLVLCVVGAVGCRFWLSSYENHENPGNITMSDFIPFIVYSTQQTPAYEGFLAFWTFIIILQVSASLLFCKYSWFSVCGYFIFMCSLFSSATDYDSVVFIC